MTPRLPAPPLPHWLRAMVPYDRYRVRAGPYAMHVMEAGDPNGFPVVMLHGNPTWGFLYRKVVAALAGSGLRIVLPDLVGLGYSDKPRDAREHTFANHGQWVAQLFDALGIERMLFVGQDWGGPIGLRALAERPSRLAGLVVLNTVLGPPREGFRPTRFHRFARAPGVSDLAFRVLGFPMRGLHRAQGDASSIEGDVARAYREPLRGFANNVAPLALARMVPDTQHHPSVAELRRAQSVVEGFRGPSAIVWGDRDPVLGRAFKSVRALLPEARVTRTSAGHFLQEEVPEAIADAVRVVNAKRAG